MITILTITVVVLFIVVIWLLCNKFKIERELEESRTWMQLPTNFQVHHLEPQTVALTMDYEPPRHRMFDNEIDLYEKEKRKYVLQQMSSDLGKFLLDNNLVDIDESEFQGKVRLYMKARVIQPVNYK